VNLAQSQCKQMLRLLSRSVTTVGCKQDTDSVDCAQRRVSRKNVVWGLTASSLVLASCLLSEQNETA
jgi:hypothetical protein